MPTYIKPSLCKDFRAWLYYKWAIKTKHRVGACSRYYVLVCGMRVLGIQFSWVEQCDTGSAEVTT